MADQVTVTNMPDSGSHEAVALALWKYLRNANNSADEQLAFYVKCRRATFGKAPGED